MRHEIRQFFQLFQVKQSKLFLLLLLRSPFDFLLSMYYANLMNTFFNHMDQMDEEGIWKSFMFFFVVTIFLFLYNGTIWSIYAAYSIKLQAKVRSKVYEKILSFSYDTINEWTSGEWLTRANNDVQMSHDLIGGGLNLPHTAVATVNIILSAMILLLLNRTLFCVAVLFLLPHMIICNVQIARPMSKLTKNSVEEFGRFTSLLEPAITGAEVVHLYDAEQFLYTKMEESSIRIRKANMKIQRKRALGNAIMSLFGLLGYLVMLLAGGYVMKQTGLSFGEITKILQYRGSLLSASMMLFNCNMNLHGNLAGMKRVNELMRKEGC